MFAALLGKLGIGAPVIAPPLPPAAAKIKKQKCAKGKGNCSLSIQNKFGEIDEFFVFSPTEANKLAKENQLNSLLYIESPDGSTDFYNGQYQNIEKVFKGSIDGKSLKFYRDHNGEGSIAGAILCLKSSNMASEIADFERLLGVYVGYSDGYRAIGYMFRGVGDETAKLKPDEYKRLQSLYSSIVKWPRVSHGGILTRRCVDLNFVKNVLCPATGSDSSDLQTLKDKVFVDRSFCSTSYYIHPLFCGHPDNGIDNPNVIMLLWLPPGTRCLSTQPMCLNNPEKEVLLPPYSSFLIQDVYKIDIGVRTAKRMSFACLRQKIGNDKPCTGRRLVIFCTIVGVDTPTSLETSNFYKNKIDVTDPRITHRYHGDKAKPKPEICPSEGHGPVGQMIRDLKRERDAEAIRIEAARLKHQEDERIRFAESLVEKEKRDAAQRKIDERRSLEQITAKEKRIERENEQKRIDAAKLIAVKDEAAEKKEVKVVDPAAVDPAAVDPAAVDPADMIDLDPSIVVSHAHEVAFPPAIVPDVLVTAIDEFNSDLYNIVVANLRITQSEFVNGALDTKQVSDRLHWIVSGILISTGFNRSQPLNSANNQIVNKLNYISFLFSETHAIMIQSNETRRNNIDRKAHDLKKAALDTFNELMNSSLSEDLISESCSNEASRLIYELAFILVFQIAAVEADAEVMIAKVDGSVVNLQEAKTALDKIIAGKVIPSTASIIKAVNVGIAFGIEHPALSRVTVVSEYLRVLADIGARMEMPDASSDITNWRLINIILRFDFEFTFRKLRTVSPTENATVNGYVTAVEKVYKTSIDNLRPLFFAKWPIGVVCEGTSVEDISSLSQVEVKNLKQRLGITTS